MKVAYVTSRFPYPVEKGDKLRAYHQILSLSKNHEVYLFSLTHTDLSADQLRPLEEICTGVFTFKLSNYKMPYNVIKAVINGLPAQVGYFFDSSIKQEMQSALISLQPDHVISQLMRTSEYVRNIPFRKTLDYMDAFSFGLMQRSIGGPMHLRPLYRMEQRLAEKYERRIYGSFDHHTIISEQDRERLPLPYKKSVQVIPNGVDTAFYTPIDCQKKWTVSFVGNMGYLPNIEAAEYLVKHVMPVVWNTLPNATVCLAGARPSQRVLKLAGKNVHVTGWMDDIREAYAQAEIFVAPMFSGMGLQNKLLEAMSMEKPCITTAIVNNAIGAEPGVQLSVGNSAQEIGGLIVKLLANPELVSDMSKSAREFVLLNFSWSVQNKKLDSLISVKKTIEKAIEI